MKIKNLAKMTVAAFSLLASVTLAKAGDIYSIDLIESPLYGGVKPTKANPLLAGQKAVIRMRLVNRGWLTTGKAWRFEPNLSSWASLTAEQIANLPMFAPKLGFVFGGDPVYATYVGTESVDSPANVFTDVYFEYTVKSGDLALPALLMGSDRKAVTPATVNPVYFIDNVSSADPIWNLTNSDSDTATLSFVTDTDLADLYDVLGESNCNNAENGMPDGPTRSSDGTGMGFYVKTVDLDENYSDPDNGIWRSVGYNETDTANGVMPSVTVSGGSATAAITVYVWVDDETVAEPYGSAAYDYDDKTFSGSRKILPVTIGAGSSSQTFQLKGLDLGKTAKVCMSSSRDRIPIGTSGYVTNWVSRTINIVQLEPSVTLTLRDLNGDATSELQCSDNYKSYIATLDVKLSTTPTGNIDVDISDDQAVLGQNIVLSTSSDKALNPWESPVTKVSFSAGDANLTKTLFVYALGSSDQIENTAATFTPSSTSAAAGQFTKWNSCKMTLKRASATVKPQDSQSTIDDMELGSDYDLTLVVGGSYNDLRNVGGNWTVKYYFKDATGKILGGKTIKNPYTATAPATVTGGDLTGKLLLTIPSVNISADAASLELWVVSPSGSVSDHAVISIPEGPSRGMEAFVVDADTEENLYEIEANEGDVKTFKFKLSEKYNNVAYAFLKPQADSMTNTISCSFYAYDGYKGVTIDSSDKGISRVAKMTMLDGEAIGRFEVVICSSEEYDATKKLDYNSGAVLTVAAANVEPVVREVRYGSTSVASGGQLSVSLPLNIDSTFRATIYEPGKGDLATFETQWYFDDDPYGGAAGDGWYSTVGDPSKTNMTHKFSSSGTWAVKVRCRDKEMAAEDEWSDEFAFTVSVDDEPAVIITPRTGGYTYYEDQTGLAESAFDVSLIGAPVISAGNGPLKVRLTVQNLGASGLVELSTNLVTFTTRQDGRSGNDALSHSFYFKALNGTIDSGNEGFAITATVENPEVDTLGRTWNPTTMNVFILNRPPVLNKPEERNDSEGKPLVTTTHIGETITIPWAVNDVLADKTNLTVTATTDEGKTWTTNTFTAGTTGQFEVRFDEAGASKTITITVTDPELDSNSATLYYTIAASKVLNIAATGPSSGDASIALSSRYARAKGLGAGRVFVSKSDATFARAEDFNLFWNCGMKTTVYAYGYGYQPDDTDDGNLIGDLDIPLDADGNTYDSGDSYYTYNPADNCGSFFYGWLKAKEAGGKDYELTPSPEIRGVKNGKVKATSTRGSIDLPQDKTEDEQGYAQTYAEAVFAKEYKESDNMGDINADGVPDYFAILDYANGRLAEPDGQGAELAAVNALNNDEDYLPGNAQLVGASFIPGETSGWSTRGAPFTARMEIRGFGGADEGGADEGEDLNATAYGGLNYGMFKFGAELETGWVSDLDLTHNEKISLLNHVFARRDAILNRRYTQRPGANKFDGGDWVVVTNLLSTLIRSDTSYYENGANARKAYIAGFNDSGEDAIDGWNEGLGLGHKILVPVTNVVAAVIGKEELYPAITNVTTNVCWVSESYTTAGHVSISITNTVEVVTNIYTVGTTVTTNLFWRTPYDSITIADVNVGEWLNRKASGTAFDIAQKAAKEYIDHIWAHYLNRDTSEWGWTCENRTDPTLDDTDGDGFSDGYEYYIWYSAVVGFNGNTLSGYRLDVTDRDSRGIPITSGEIARLYNPNVEGSVKRDTDEDGIADYEEMVLGTNPFHWDTDGDGLSDGYELTYNMDPLSASGEHGCDMNTDGDFMAFVDVADNNEREEFQKLLQYRYIYTATNGTTWAFSTNLTAEIRYIAQRYPTTKAFELAGVKAFKVGKYGVTKYTDDSGVTKYYDDYYIPATEKLDKLLEFLDPDATAYELDSAWTNAATFVINPQIAPVTLRVDKRNTGLPEPPDVAMGLFHHQVHSALGFDPRTGWYSSGNGLSMTSRWKNNAGSVVPGGAPQNTVAYTAKYEYNLPKYLKIVNSYVVWNPTNPGVPYEATSESEDGEISHYMTQHGADTDADGVPDGWELYIGVDPGVVFTSNDESAYNSIRDIDKADGLTLAYEFAGTDSCGVYSECASIYKYHPSQDEGTMKNWYNKFFPTDPRESDSDGDSIDDGTEGKNWKDTLVINRIPQTDDASVLINYFSIYGSPADDGTTSIRGGGYNPCTIDTDSDGLPDPWERQFTGVLFKGTTISDTEGMSVFGEGGGKIDERVRKDIKTALVAYDIPTNVLAGAEFYHILMGMDGTVADAATSTALGASDLDWDGDGLQNWQEYLVQAMRQFRYDDDKTPLLGRDCPNVTANGETPGSWNGDKGFLKVSYTEPFTDVQLDFIDEELGYHNFAFWAKNTENYLKHLGYFIDPPMAWDHARNTLNQKYMLPPANIRYYTFAKGKSQATDGDGNAIYTYELAYKTYEFTNNVSGVVTSGYGLVGDKYRKLTPKMVENSALAMDTYVVSPGKYFTTDPRRWDTDADGMDDYYELFHGLNPILGEVTREAGMHGTYSRNKDIIARATDGKVSPGNNAWIGWANEEAPVYDPIRYPWLMGAGECDADSDGLRNIDESLLANVTSPNAMHTDPTPLWMTDASVKTRSSKIIITTNTPVMIDIGGGIFVPVWDYDPKTGEEFQVYQTTTVDTDEKVDLVDTPSYTALFYENELKGKGVNNSSAMASLPYGGWKLSDSAYAFSFEQNEGYDTDNDWRSDSAELQNSAEPTSDPLNFADPQRRQSVWFGGPEDQGMLVSREESKRKTGGADLFKQFTVEAWVRPENPLSGKEQYIVSRAVYCNASSVINTNAQVRLDFALGLDANGCAFGELMNSVDISYRQTGDALPQNEWTHLAATFDGYNFTLYMNGKPVDSGVTTLIPANGTKTILQNPHFSRMEGGSYSQDPSIMAIGARPVGETIFNIANVSSATGWSDIATDFFKGSVDEVRCWDGARTADEIKGDYRTRYTTERVKENRLAVYNAYRAGGSRNDTNGRQILPPELIHHYNFSTLAGAHEADYVQQVPAGFGSRLLASVCRPDDGTPMDGNLLKIGWWSGVVGNADIGSKVYTSPHVVPWVEDTVAHLPKLCGSVADSVFWSENFAGYVAAEDNGLSTYSFPNSMSPYNVVETLNEYSYLRAKLAKVSNTTNETENAYPETSLIKNGSTFGRFYYDNRRGFSGNSDLVPLGSAFAKRLTDYWDGIGPEDAWAITSKAGEDDGDPDLEGIPNWAIEAGYTTTASYIRALANGARPGSEGGASDPYCILNQDLNDNGIPDWWEKIHGIVDQGAYDDADNDGLSNYHEWWLSEGGVEKGFGKENGFPALDPNKARTLYSEGQRVPDYFLGIKGTGSQWDDVYFGFIATDHDFIENWWEKQYANGYSNASVYDPLGDWDENGWSNYAEARYQMWRGLYSADQLDGWNVDGSFHVDYSPEPALAIRSTYYGVQDLTSNLPHPQIPTIVTATRTSETAGRIDAKFIAVPSDVNNSDDGNACNQYLGPYRAGSIKHGFLSPGCVVPTTVLFYKANTGNADYKYWKLVWKTSIDGPNHWVEAFDDSGPVTNHYSGAIASYTSFLQRYPTAQLENAPLTWELVASAISDAQNRMATLVHADSGEKVGMLDLHSGEYSLDMTAVAESDSNPDQLSSAVFMVAYASKIGNEWPQTLYYSNTKELDLSVEGNQRGVGRVMEGENMVTSLIDLDQSGDYTAGEPFGVISGVDVGWHKVPEQVVELKDTSHVVPRFDLVNLADDRTKVKGVAGLVTYTGEPLDTAAKVARIYITRTAINGEAAPNRIVLSKTYVLPDNGANSHARTFIHEGDVLKGGRFDLDSDWLATDAERMGIQVGDIKSATYEIGQHVDLPDGSVSNVVLAAFVNTFATARAVAAAELPVDGGTVFSAAPKFRWTCDDDTMTAFDLQVFDASENLIYESGIKLLPGRVDGAYEFNPWLYADAPVSTNGAPVFADGTNYFWRVAMLNAKYNTADSEDAAIWSAKTPFRMDLSHKELTTGYGSANAIVRYYGPCGRKPKITGTDTSFEWGDGYIQDISSGSGLVIVEAFENADFHGRPMAQIRLSDYADLYSTTNITTVNATLRGLDPGTLYFRAYIDLNNNGRREEWEPWGYANHVDTEWLNANGARDDWEEWGNSFHYDGTGKVYSEAIYDPLGIVVTDNPSMEKPTFVIYIEDCDVNRNNIPDSLEEIERWDENEDGVSDADGDGLLDPEEGDYFTDPLAKDSDGDGTPDGWEAKFANTDPLSGDADDTVDGDVMAYVEETWKLVTDQNGFVYLVDPANDAVAVGDDLPLSRLVSTYDYAGKRGVGTNLLDTATTIRVAKVEPVTVALVHAQVYDRFGFNPLTAVPAEGAVNTKPFTALDKYLVIRYLEAMGFCSEENVNVTGAWAQYSLVPSDRDNDRDGVADGWELYTMFGPGGSASVASLAEVKVSPWNYNDARSTSPSIEDESFRLIDEYDGGVLPTDPWTKDTDGDGIPDNFAFRYHLKGNQFDSDPDRDGLSNYQEYLISEVYYDSLVPSYKLDPDNAHSQSQAVSDYFLQHNKLYYGELFADHDHIDDMWEDAQPVVTTRGGTVLANYSRFVYDANRDVLGHGWDNWALSRAWFDGVYVTNIIAEATNSADGTVMVTTNSVLTSTFVDNGGNPSPKIPLSVTYHGKGGNFFGETTKYQVVVKAWNLDRRADPEVLGKPDKIWSSTITSPAYLEIDGFASGYSSETGSVKPGRNMFVAYVAEGEAEEGVAAPSYVAGMPFGVVTDVEVGPIGCENVNIEMTDTNASMPRIDIVNALKLQDVYAQAAGAGSEDALTLYKEVAEKYTDRGRWGAYDQLRKSDYVGLDTRGASTNEINKVRVRILRSGVNGQFELNGVKLAESNPVLDTILPVGTQDTITEADFLSACPDADLDWGAVRKLYAQHTNKEHFNFAEVDSVCYRIVLFDGTVDRDNETNNNLSVMFENRYEKGWLQTPVTNMEVRTYSGQPTFSWTHDNTIGKAYPAFQLRVWEEDGTTLVFDSGVQRAPVSDAMGRYNWTAPLWVGSMTDKDIVFEPNKVYLWSVSMLDAKFTVPGDFESPDDKETGKQETQVKFMMQETSPSGGSSDYGIIPVKVKYLGPGEVSTDKHVKCLRVEAFTSPDFIGIPAGAGYVYDDSELGTIDGISVNAKIVGLPANRDYYVRAYIDTDGNGVHDAWESWGYACYRGSTVRLDQYEPRAFSPGNAAQSNDCVVYVEDADTNCNMVPDILEYQTDGNGQKLLSPYIAYTASDASKIAAVDDAKSGTSGNKKTLKSAPKQYAYAVSCAAISNGSVTPGLLAVATGGVNCESTDSTHIKIKSFSLEEGISLEVVVDEDYQVVSYGYDTGTIKVGVEYATTLENGGDWQSAGEPDSISFPLKAGTTEIGAESLDGIKAAIEKIESKVAGAAYFRVKAVAIE